MECLVFYDEWQMQCCGTEFSIGDSVNWLVQKAKNIPISDEAGFVDYYYEAHVSDWQKLCVLEVKVDGIRIRYERFTPSTDDRRILVSAAELILDAQTAGNPDEERDDMQATGYIVSLVNCEIRPAKQEEVTYV